MAEDEKKLCAGCGTLIPKKQTYCTHCGTPSANKCTFDGGLAGEPCGHKNADDAVYCAKCGSPTAYYKAGLVQPSLSGGQFNKPEETDELSIFQHPFFLTD